MMIEALTEEVEDLGLTGRDVNEEQDAYMMMIEMMMMVMIMIVMIMMVIMMIDDNDDSDYDEVEPTYLCKRMPLF